MKAFLIRASSIRPANTGTDFQTPFTRISRHTYVDPDYGYTQDEEEARRKHRNKYLNYLKEQAQNRKDKENLKYILQFLLASAQCLF